jgi:hypothetical protein
MVSYIIIRIYDREFISISPNIFKFFFYTIKIKMLDKNKIEYG